MFAKDVNIKSSEIPSGWSPECADFINKLLKRKRTDRLGRNGIVELKDHPWLRGIQWQDMYRKEVETPFVPKDGDNFDSAYCNRIDPIDKNTYDYFVHKINTENYFAKFFYNYYDQNSKEIFFEFDGVQYKFQNPYDEKTNETTVGKHMKSSIVQLSTNTPRLYDANTPNTNLSFTQSQLPSNRKLVYK
jgi:hypothetical protein